jgi:hypothetical protein
MSGDEFRTQLGQFLYREFGFVPKGHENMTAHDLLTCFRQHRLRRIQAMVADGHTLETIEVEVAHALGEVSNETYNAVVGER